MKQSETAIHFQGRGRWPLGRSLEVSVFAGLSWYRLRQDVVSAVEFAETYPYDVLAPGRVTLERSSGTGIGFNAGGDVSYYFTSQVGVGASAGFSRGTIDIPLGDRDVEVGFSRTRLAVGLCLRF